MRFASLGSGSQGNALIVEAGATRLLLDCGFSTRVTIQRLARLGLPPEGVDAVLVTHEHSDHIAGAFKFAARYRIPVLLSHGTFSSLPGEKAGIPECRLIDSHEPFSIGDLEITPYPVPHDAREPVQFTFFDGQQRLGVLTDTGTVTQHIINVLQHCEALVLECNHDRDLLERSNYPGFLKQRISGGQGHLENQQAATLLRRVETKRLQHVVAAHLSQQNNRPELAVSALAAALDCAEEWIAVATQNEGLGWRQLL